MYKARETRGTRDAGGAENFRRSIKLLPLVTHCLLLPPLLNSIVISYCYCHNNRADKVQLLFIICCHDNFANRVKMAPRLQNVTDLSFKLVICHPRY